METEQRESGVGLYLPWCTYTCYKISIPVFLVLMSPVHLEMRMSLGTDLSGWIISSFVLFRTFQNITTKSSNRIKFQKSNFLPS